jgi:predicted DNA-binding ArsR family transcriptional regulator
MNLDKTEMMTINAKKHRHMTQQAYDRKITSIGALYKEKQILMVECQWCNKNVQQRSLKKHHLSARCTKIKKKTMLEENDMIQQHSVSGEVENDMIQQHSVSGEVQEEEIKETTVYQIDMPLTSSCECPCEECFFELIREQKRDDTFDQDI